MGGPSLPSILGDGAYAECQLLVRAPKRKDLQKALSLFEAVLFTRHVTGPTMKELVGTLNYILFGDVSLLCRLCSQDLGQHQRAHL